MPDTYVQTNWVAFTGAPSSGKTSVIDALAARGWKTEPEAARQVIEDLLKAGHTLEEVRAKDYVGRLQHDILAAKLRIEKKQDPQDTVFLDRGIPDSLAYYKISGLDTRDAAKSARLFRYRAVFSFDRLPIVADGIRTESDADAKKIGDLLDAEYKELGYDVLRVPVLPIDARADFILNTLGLSAP